MKLIDFYRSQDYAVKFLLDPNTSFASIMSKYKMDIFARFSTEVIKNITPDTTNEDIIMQAAEVLYSYNTVPNSDYSKKCFTSINSIAALAKYKEPRNEYMTYLTNVFVPNHDIRTIEGLWDLFAPFLDKKVTKACNLINSVYHTIIELRENEEIQRPICEILPYLRTYIYFVSKTTSRKVANSKVYYINSDDIINRVYEMMSSHEIGAYQDTNELYERSKVIEPSQI